MPDIKSAYAEIKTDDGCQFTLCSRLKAKALHDLNESARIEDVNARAKSFETIIQAALSAFDNFVTPIDIECIPDFIEKPLDAACREALKRCLEAVRQRILASE